MTKFIVVTEATSAKDPATGEIIIKPYRKLAIPVNEILRVDQGRQVNMIHFRTELYHERLVRVIDSFDEIVEKLI